MYEHMKDYEPREALFEALGMVNSMRKLEGAESKQDALDDVSYIIRWTLANAVIFKKPESSKHGPV